MSAWVPIAIGSGLGLMKYMEDKKDEPRKRKIEEAKARYYPWVGLAPKDVQKASVWDTVGGGALAGAQIASNLGLGFGGEEAAAEEAVPVLGDGQNAYGEDEFNAYDRYVMGFDGNEMPEPAYVPPGENVQYPGLGAEWAQDKKVAQSVDPGARSWRRAPDGTMYRAGPGRGFSGYYRGED